MIKDDTSEGGDSADTAVGDKADGEFAHEEDEEGEDDRVGAVYDAEVTIESFNDVKVQFSALELIEKGTRRRPGSDTNTDC